MDTLLKEFLGFKNGIGCQGCGESFPDIGFLELGHFTPPVCGGSDDFDNRLLLCLTCKTIKGDNKTLPGLRQENRKRGYKITDINHLFNFHTTFKRNE